MQKAWLYEEHGPKEVLKLVCNIPVPLPQPDQLLVRVHAAALNPIDFKLRQNPATVIDLPVVPGCDMAGVVVAKGEAVERFQVGDEVYGNIQNFTAQGKLKQLGTLAEYVVVEERLVAKKPKRLSFEEAASLPLALQTAMEGFKVAGFSEGQSVFVVGGAGGVGSLVVQIAKLSNASIVAATSSTKKVEFVKGLGADKVLDYTQTRYEDVEEKYDLVYDTVGDSRNSCIVAKDYAPVIDITWPPTNPRAVYSGLTVSGEILDDFSPYLETGKMRAVIDPAGVYSFSEAVEAFGYLETGRVRGKLVISHSQKKTIL